METNKELEEEIVRVKAVLNICDLYGLLPKLIIPCQKQG
jgi:hypothetical protein